MPPDSGDSVDFLSSPEPPQSPQSPPSRRSLFRNRRWELTLAALILAGIALWQTGFHSKSNPSASPAAAATSAVNTADPGPDALRDPARCPAVGSCATTANLPAEVVAAVRDAVPNARLGTASTIWVVGGGLWYRQMSARAGAVEFRVQVQRPVSATSARPPSTGTHMYVRKQVPGFVVQVQAFGPRNALPSTATLERLAGDPRLVQLG